MYPTAKNFKPRYHFPPSNPAFEKFVDIYGGHARLGTGDYVYPNSQTTSQSVRYIVFLRNPIERYVSGMLYQNKVQAHDQINQGKWPAEFKEAIPKKVREISEEEYSKFDKSAYPEI
jgi:multidrug efflux pump subunit AcrA (membrane-fusion protein)